MRKEPGNHPPFILPFENTNNFVLAELCRTKIRKHLLQLDKHTNLIVRIPQLGLPTSLTEYLLHDIAIDERTINKPFGNVPRVPLPYVYID